MSALAPPADDRASPEAAFAPRARPARTWRRLVIGLTLFSAVTAIAGGVELVLWPRGNAFVPLDLLAGTAFTTFTIPGLLLGLVVGGASAACAVATWRRSRYAVDLALLAGGAMTVWIVAEVALMGELHWLHGLYGALGVAVLALGGSGALRSREARHRWIVLVTGAEALGFLVPAVTGVAAAGLGALAQGALLVGAGVVEGAALGAGQAWALPVRVDRVRYVGLTALAAGVVWAAAMIAVGVGGVAWVAAAAIGLVAIGGAQWLELRRHVARAHPWIAWTALAWLVALPISFLPGPLVDEATPASSVVTLFACAGLVMAYVMALVTWQGARRLGR